MPEMSTAEAISIIEQYINERRAGEKMLGVLVLVQGAEQRQSEIKARIAQMETTIADKTREFLSLEESTEGKKADYARQVTDAKEKADEEIRAHNKKAEDAKQRSAEHVRRMREQIGEADETHRIRVQERTQEIERLDVAISGKKEQIAAMEAAAAGVLGKKG
jgi:hypothetical protein